MIFAVQKNTHQKDPSFRPSMTAHGTQHAQSRPELLVILGKCLFQNAVDGELSQIEVTLFRDPRHVSQQLLDVHCRISERGKFSNRTSLLSYSPRWVDHAIFRQSGRPRLILFVAFTGSKFSGSNEPPIHSNRS